MGYLNCIQLLTLDRLLQNTLFLHLPVIPVPKEIPLLDPLVQNGSLVWELVLHPIGKWAVILFLQLLLMKIGIYMRVLFQVRVMLYYGATSLRWMKSKLLLLLILFQSILLLVGPVQMKTFQPLRLRKYCFTIECYPNLN